MESVYKAINTASAGINTGVSVQNLVENGSALVSGAGMGFGPDDMAQSLSLTGGSLAGAASLAAGAAGKAAGIASKLGAGKLGGLFGGGASGGGLMFPTDLGSATSMNYMGFQAYDIVGGIGSAKTDRDYEMKGTPMYLPIPDSGINEPFTQNWGEGDVSMFEAALANTAASMGPGIVEALQTGNLGSASIEGMKEAGMAGIHGAKATGEAFLGLAKGDDWDKVGQGVLSGLQTALNISNSKGVAQAAVGLGMMAAGQPLSQAAGLAGFKETAYLYRGPGFRPWSFTFSLKPTSAAESSAIQGMIANFRYHGRPTENAGDLYRIYSLPSAWEIKFYSTGGENHNLPKLGKCVLTGFNAKYGGDRFSTFSGTHAPVQIDLQMNFMEIELQTRMQAADLEQGAAGTGAVDSFGAFSGGGLGGMAAGALGGAIPKFP